MQWAVIVVALVFAVIGIVNIYFGIQALHPAFPALLREWGPMVDHLIRKDLAFYRGMTYLGFAITWLAIIVISKK